MTHSHDPQAGALFDQADALYADGQLSLAIETYTRGLLLDPHSPYGYTRRGLAVLDQGDAERALRDFERALEIDPAHAPAYYGRGAVRHIQEDFEGELVDALRGLELAPNNPGPFLRRCGSAYEGLGRATDAIEAYTQAIAVSSHDAGALVSRGNLRCELGQYDAALEDYNRALEIAPGWDWAINGRGIVALKRKDFPRAIAEFTCALEQDPSSVAALHNRAHAYQAVGAASLALADFERAEAAEPGNEYIARLRRELAASLDRTRRRLLWARAARVMVGGLAGAFFCIFGLVSLIAPPIIEPNVAEVEGTLASFDQIGAGLIVIQLAEHDNVFEIVRDDFDNLRREAFEREVRPGDMVAITTFRRRLGELGSGTRLPVFQLRTDRAVYMAFSDVSADRRAATRTMNLLFVGLPFVVLCFCISQEITLYRRVRQRNALLKQAQAT